ncbi:MAG: cation diffusion facilitator family transporter [Ruminococcus sp.]|nr:cation diffusion facilitator family transporter [Ruminococcus sp.]
MTKLLIKLFVKDSNNIKDAAVRVRYGYLGSVTGIVLNILLFAGKLIAGIISGAISVTADAFNNLSDAGSSIVSLVGFKMAALPADEEHPFGHGRMEYVSGLIISFLILLMGFELAHESVLKMISPKDIRFSWLTLCILIASVLVKLWMGLFNLTLGKRINSTSMKATAADSISDCISTSAVIVAMLVFYFAGVNIDSIIGLLVALFILYNGVKTFRESLTPLLGTKPDKEFVDEITAAVEKYPDIVGTHDLIVHDYGVGNLIISMHAEVPMQMEFNAAHELVDMIEDELKKKYNCLVTIHMDPVAVNDERVMAVKAQVSEVVRNIDSRMSIHDFRMTDGRDRVNLIFDLVVPFGLGMTDAQVRENVSAKVSALDKAYCCVISIDREYA